MKTIKRITVYECKCGRCHHSWVAQVSHPKQCPACKSPLWDTERVRAIKPGAMAQARVKGAS